MYIDMTASDNSYRSNGFEKDETLLNIFFDSLGVMFFGADFEEKVNDLKAALGEDWVEIIIKEFNEEGWSESFASMDLLVENERIKANEKLKEKYKDYTFEF